MTRVLQQAGAREDAVWCLLRPLPCVSRLFYLPIPIDMHDGTILQTRIHAVIGAASCEGLDDGSADLLG